VQGHDRLKRDFNQQSRRKTERLEGWRVEVGNREKENGGDKEKRTWETPNAARLEKREQKTQKGPNAMGGEVASGHIEGQRDRMDKKHLTRGKVKRSRGLGYVS